jgi:cell division septation protein DedD
VPQRAGAIGAPWDTAGTASGKAARRVHVYPSGVSPLGKRLVDSLPDPGGAAREDAPAAPAPAPAAPASPSPPAPTRVDSTQSIGESGCWEVQLLVSSDHDRAEEMAKRVERDLDVAAWVQRSGGLYRVRAGGCLSPDGAGALARQLKQEGYPEAFRVMRESP